MSGIRIATPGDAEAILAIYAPYIVNTSLTFETEVPSVREFAERIDSYLQTWPWLVYEADGIIAGYACASRYRERMAYRWCVQCSVYIHDDYLRTGIGRKLYTVLFELLKMQGFRNAYAVINLPNDRSVTFHESMGFKWFATYDRVGYKLGDWKDVGWWRLIINEFSKEPEPPVPFPGLKEKARLIINRSRGL